MEKRFRTREELASLIQFARDSRQTVIAIHVLSNFRIELNPSPETALKKCPTRKTPGDDYSKVAVVYKSSKHVDKIISKVKRSAKSMWLSKINQSFY